jgi:cytokinin riboside 5'-monophosphate phosphoribohydrolase
MPPLGKSSSRSDVPAQRYRPLSVAVFCSAGPGTPATMKTAQELGELIGKNRHRLVYGGGGAGVMGELAQAAYRHNSQIVGTIPDFIFEREDGNGAPPQVLRLTQTICQRKDIMLAMADIFIAMPGGLETVDVALDVISLSCLDLNTRPLLLLQTCGEWEPLLHLLTRLVEDGQADPMDDELLRVVGSASEALDIVNAYAYEPDAR